VLAEELKGFGSETGIIPVEKVKKDDNAGIFYSPDIIIFAYPAYGGEMPLTMEYMAIIQKPCQICK
jgi:hypothetical protein